MVHARYMERYPVQQVDWRERELTGYPTAPRQDEASRAAFAADALEAAWPDCGPCADRLALLELCNPRALDGEIPGWDSAGARVASVFRAFFLTVFSRFRGIPALSGRELRLEQSVPGGHPDR
jgi:hypothetical protein